MKRFLIIMISLLAGLSVKAQVQVEASIDSVAIFIGQQAHLTLDVTAKRGQRVQLPQYKERQILVPGVEVIESSAADTTSLDDGLQKISKRITLTSFDEKLYAIPSIKVKVDGKDYSSGKLALKVITVDVDTLHPNQYFPPKDVQDNPFQWSEWRPLFWLSVLMILLCAAGCWLYIRLRENKPIVAKIRIVKKMLPHQKALKEIEKLKVDRSAMTDDSKEYYVKLTDTLRQYIEERFGFSAKEMTSTEIIDNLQQSGDKTMIDELRDLFRTADLVKFAKYSTLINENDLNLVNAMNFIDKTKLEGESTTEKIVPKLTEEQQRSQKARVAIKCSMWIIGIVVVALLAYILYSASQLL